LLCNRVPEVTHSGNAILATDNPGAGQNSSAGQSFYLPFLDGLRAISILLVLGFHQLGPFTGRLGAALNGWVGVDLFFIISGFLISTILLQEREKRGTFSLKNFYVRRWLRICPAYYAFLAFMFVFMLARGQHDYSAFAIAGLYLTNVDICAGWGLCTLASGLAHTWSLSVEEQFYLLWPATLKISGKNALKICLALIAAVYAWRLFLLSCGAGWLRISTGLDTKLDSIMLGVALAILWTSTGFQSAARSFFSGKWRQLALLASLLVACHFLGHPGVETQPWLFWEFKLPLVLFLMTTFLLSLLANPTTIAGKILSSKPLVWIGKLSYSLYLWHVVVNFPCTHAIFQAICHHKQYLVELAKYATCFGFAASSYYFIERPFLKLKNKFS
jgi:peptidoglycan/LPS O-acetylase OafA/YrhL